MPAITNPRVYISNLGNASTDMYRGMYAKYKAVLIHLCAELHSKKLIDSESLRGWGGGEGRGLPASRLGWSRNWEGIKSQNLLYITIMFNYLRNYFRK